MKLIFRKEYLKSLFNVSLINIETGGRGHLERLPSEKKADLKLIFYRSQIGNE